MRSNFVSRDAHMETFEPLLLRHEAGRAALALKDSQYWKLVRLGELEVVGQGRSSRVVYASLKRYVHKLIEQAQNAKPATTAP
jgi:hypothetical protein